MSLDVALDALKAGVSAGDTAVLVEIGLRVILPVGLGIVLVLLAAGVNAVAMVTGDAAQRRYG